MAMEGTQIEQMYVAFRADYSKLKSDIADIKQTVRSVQDPAKATTTALKTGMNEAEGAVRKTTTAAKELKKEVQVDKAKITGPWSAFRDQLKSLIAPMALVMLSLRAIKSVIREVGESVKLAMDVHESVTLFNTSLGEMSGSTRAWAAALAEALGLNQFEIERTTGLWFTMVKSMGLAEDQALSMTKNLVQLKYDIMSFYNNTAEEAETIIKGMIAGETEPAKRIGVILTEAMAKKALLNEGIIKEGQEIDATTMMYGRYLTLIQQTTVAQGDMARTLDSPKNATRRLEAALIDLRLTLGNAFLPIWEVIVPAITSLVRYMQIMADVFGTFTASLTGGRTAGLQHQLSEVGGATTTGADAWEDYGNKSSAALGKTASGVSKLRATILGFDQLNVMSENVASAGGASGGGSGGMTFPIPEVPLPDVSTTSPDVITFKENFGKIVQFVKDRWDSIKLFLLASPVFAPIAGIIEMLRVINQLRSEAIPEYDFLPDGITEETAAKLEPFMQLWNDTQTTFKQWAWGNMEVTDEMATTMATAVTLMADQITAAIDEQTTESLDTWTTYFAKSNTLTEEEEAAILEKVRRSGDDRKTTVDGYATKINEIYLRAANEHRGLTETEKRQIGLLQEDMKNAAIGAMSESSAEQQLILDHLRLVSGDLSARQASDIVKNSAAARDAAIDAAIQTATDVINEATRMREAGLIDEETYNKIVADAESTRDDAIAAAQQMHTDIVAEAKAQAGEHVGEVDWETGEIKTKWQVLIGNLWTWATSIANAIAEWLKPFSSFRDEFLKIFTTIVETYNNTIGKITGKPIVLPKPKSTGGGTDPNNRGSGTGSGRMDFDGSTSYQIDTYTPIRSFASGGLPESGELFRARERGPEFVGRLGGGTAVANNDQIVEAVSQGVADAVSSVMDGQGNIYIYLDSVLERTISRKNARAGKIRIPIGG